MYSILIEQVCFNSL